MGTPSPVPTQRRSGEEPGLSYALFPTWVKGPLVWAISDFPRTWRVSRRCQHDRADSREVCVRRDKRDNVILEAARSPLDSSNGRV